MSVQEALVLDAGVRKQLPTGDILSGISVVDVQTATYTTQTTTTASIPFDTSVPLSTEGLSLITIAHSLKDSGNSVLLIGDLNVAHSSNGGTITFPIFAGTTNVVTGSHVPDGGGNRMKALQVTGVHAPGVTTSITYDLRIGTSAGTLYLNRTLGVSALFGGSLIMRLTLIEFQP